MSAAGRFVVIVPTYNRASTLPRALDSLLSQTDPDWRCWVLDDGSTDDTPGVMADYRGARIRYWRWEANAGGVAMNEIGMAMACVPGRTRVNTTEGLKRIDSIRAGDLVVTAELKSNYQRVGFGAQFDYPVGRFAVRRVLAAVDRGVKSTVVVATRRRAITSTPDHRFCVLRSEPRLLDASCPRCSGLRSVAWGSGYRRCQECGRVWRPGSRRIAYRFEWVEAASLRPGDRLLSPSNVVETGRSWALPNIPILHGGEDRPLEVTETSDGFCRLAGYLLADGVVYRTHGRRPHQVEFCEPPGTRYRETYQNLVTSLFGINSFTLRPYGFVVSSVYLASLVVECGLSGRARDKRVPEWVFSLPASQRRSMIVGYMDGDGHYFRDRFGRTEWRMKCASLELMLGMKTLAESLGWRASRVRSGNGHLNGKTYAHWLLTVYPDHERSARSRKASLSNNAPASDLCSDIVVRVSSGSVEQVYDLEVEGEHSFFADGVLVHNCDHGEFWVRLGSDDWFLPEKLALDRIALGEYGACFGPYQNDPPTLMGELNVPMDARATLLSGVFAVSWANIACRVSVLDEIRRRYGNFCDPRLRNMEDYLFNTRLARVTEITWRAMAEDGSRVIVGATSPDQVPFPYRPDARYTVAADSASYGAMSRWAAHDAQLTEIIRGEDAQRNLPIVECPRPAPRVYGLEGSRC